MSKTKAMTAVAETAEKENGEQAFDRDEWVRQKREERKHAYDTIDQMSGLVAQGGSWMKIYLDLQSRFPNYSAGNVLLLGAQKPDAVKVADVKTWNAMGANVRHGESAIVILEPRGEYTREDGTTRLSFNPKKVFDISQTTAKGTEEPEIRRDERLLLKALVYDAPCDVTADDGSRLPEWECADYDHEEHTIFVARDKDPRELFPAIARELALARMDGPGYMREDFEYKAACVSYILCRRNGIEVSGDAVASPPESFSGLSPRAVRKELAEIRETANGISRDMDRMYETQREQRRGDAR